MEWDRSKKGDGHLYSILIVIFTFIILASAAYLFQSKFQSLTPRQIGDKQFALYDVYQAAENVLFFIDEASRYSTMQAVYDLSAGGGYFTSTGEDLSSNVPDSPCKTYLGYALWNEKDAECFPYDVTSNLERGITDNLAKYIKHYTYVDIPLDYRIGIDGNVVWGKALKRIQLSQRLDADMTELTSSQMRDVTGQCDVPFLVVLDAQCLQTTETACKAIPLVAERFSKAQEIARSRGLELQVTSAYRSYESQRALWESLGKDTSRVARPSCEAPHTLGKAVDVVIKGGAGMSAVSMGDMSIGDRQILEDIMIEAGFVRYIKEFWHFEYGTDRWSKGQEQGVRALQ